jgi:hypothetical protein
VSDAVAVAPPPVDELLLPVGTRLVHIGPQKTGTTALQSAFHANRPRVREQGVLYAGSARQPMTAALAVVGRPIDARTDRIPPITEWERLVRSIERAREPRVVVSAEALADARKPAIARIVRDLDPARVHVVVTLRPLARILSSQWQQYVQAGVTVSFEEWLDAILYPGRRKLTPSFWHRHRHDRLIARWAEAVGFDRMTVVVADDRDRDRILRVFERFVGLEAGTLVAEDDLANRSLTLGEVEIIRAFNAQFRAAELPMRLHTAVVRHGASELLKRRPPASDERRIRLPPAAAARAAEIAAEIVANIRAMPVRVVGDLDSLVEVPEPGSEGVPSNRVTVSAETAGFATMSMVVATGLARGTTNGSDGTDVDEVASGAPTARAASARRRRPGRSRGRRRGRSEAQGLHRIRNRQILRVLRQRTEARIANRWHAIPEPVRTRWLSLVPRVYRWIRHGGRTG